MKSRPESGSATDTANIPSQESRALENGRHERAPSRSLLAVKVDLQELQPKRGEGPGRYKTMPVKLPSSIVDLSLILPEGSLSGVYRIAIEDAFSNTKTSVHASSSDGVRLIARFNLTWLRGGQYIMCISHAQEAPMCYPLIIETARDNATNK
jgi:hypothetical protein